MAAMAMGAEGSAPQWVTEAIAQGDVPIKQGFIANRDGDAAVAEKASSGGSSGSAAAAAAAAPVNANAGSERHYDSREAAAARQALPQEERTLKFTLKTEDEEIFAGEKTMTVTVTKTRQLCRAVEKELGEATRGMPVTLLLDGAVLCEKNGGLGMLGKDTDATLWVKLQTGSNRAKRQRVQASGANDTPLGEPGTSAKDEGSRMSKRQQKLERRKAQVEASREKKHQLCVGIATKNVCSYGPGCRFSHDVPAYLKLKPDDIGSPCPFFSKYGRCPYGVLCRFGSEHITDGGTVIREDAMPLPHEAAAAAASAEAPAAEVTPASPDSEQAAAAAATAAADAKRGESLSDKMMLTVRSSNHMPKVVQQRLRKNKYTFRIAEERARVARKETAAARATLQDVSRRNWGTEISTAGAGATDSVPSDVATDAKQTAREASAAVQKFRSDIEGKLYLAPLTTVGNLPYRRVCVGYGCDITCGEMAMAKNLLAGQSSEWALLRRHECETANGQLFGVQVAGAHVDMMTKVAELIEDHISLDFVDINMGCPIDIVCNKGMGCGMAERPARMEEVVRGMSSSLSKPLTVKMRMGKKKDRLTAHEILPRLNAWGCAAATLHGRTKEQRYTKEADWSYIETIAANSASVPLIGNGDVYSYQDAIEHLQAMRLDDEGDCDGDSRGVSALMLARGALIKPWLFTEIKERRHWDISSSERFDMLKDFTTYGLEHWGSDDQGVLNVRKFLMEWLSFLHRYVPVGLMERPDLSTKINLRPPGYYGRDELETLMGSHDHVDWLKITDRLLPMGTQSSSQADPLKHWKPSSISNAWRKSNGADDGNGDSEAIQG